MHLVVSVRGVDVIRPKVADKLSGKSFVLPQEVVAASRGIVVMVGGHLWTRWKVWQNCTFLRNEISSVSCVVKN